MSDYQHERGQIMPINRLENESDKDYTKNVFGDDFKEENWDEDDGILDFIYASDLEDKYMFLNDTIYKILKIEDLDPYGDVNILTQNSDGSLSFECRYYNGGTCLQEMIEEKLNEE